MALYEIRLQVEIQKDHDAGTEQESVYAAAVRIAEVAECYAVGRKIEKIEVRQIRSVLATPADSSDDLRSRLQEMIRFRKEREARRASPAASAMDESEIG